MLQSSKACADMQLLPRVCFCFLTLSGLTFGDRSGSPVITVTVKEDEDVILPCSLGTSENIESVLFDWKKEGTSPPKEVFMYDPDSPDTRYRDQDEQFKGRVSHFPGELKQGNASIRITKVRLEDKGNYICIFPRTKPSQKEFTIELVVGAVQKPYVTMQNKGQLECEILGASPKPMLQWWDSDNKTLSSKMLQDREDQGRFYIIIQTTVTKPGCYHCVATQMDIWHQTSKEICVHERQIVRVKEGDDAILPCSLKTSESIESKPFSWTKKGPADEMKVFLYDTGNIDRTGQDKKFRGRVSHFPDELKNGNASITIKNMKLTDHGEYTCNFPQQPESNDEIILLVDATSGNVMIRSTAVSVIFGIIGIIV
ncbi:butyrophilin subfamily 1 member A1-like [Archocentrus centrarchus]|uniref:butyrophilin subfamily 1 member A1-like n=1 Tax=Archocentrus centrarchus TaxID=63155 RepID=UPI0011EA29D3|nr:butyrophilin subfamily 1 member A1-like [Archocentrus centrarchus]